MKMLIQPCSFPGCDDFARYRCGGLCAGHYSQKRRVGSLSPIVRYRTTADRFWAKVSGDDYSDCWIWTGATDRGYGRFYLGKRDGRHQTTLAHRWAYEAVRGPIPNELVLDHLCRTPSCVNPWHLEPVSIHVNIMRGDAVKTHCLRGHEYTLDNTRFTRNKGRRTRVCRKCDAIRNQRRSNKRRQAS